MVAPVLPPAGDAAAIATAEAAAKEAAKIRARRKARALGILCLSVRDEVIPHISELNDPEIVWNTIKALYKTNGNARRLLLKAKLYNLRLEEGGLVANFLKEVREIANQLHAIGEVMGDETVVEHVLNALPESYKNFMTLIGLESQIRICRL